MFYKDLTAVQWFIATVVVSVIFGQVGTIFGLAYGYLHLMKYYQ